MIGLILAAGGTGSRFGAEIPKQFLDLNGMPVYQHSVQAFSPICDQIVLVVPEHRLGQTEKEIRHLPEAHGISVIPGGSSRQASVASGLRALEDPALEVILVHDAARPFVSANLVTKVLQASQLHGACVPGLPVTETVKEVSPDSFVLRTIDRSCLRLIQTPQGFRANLLREAFARAERDGFVGTDESSLVERLGVAIQVIEGEADNVKVTWPSDLPRQMPLKEL